MAAFYSRLGLAASVERRRCVLGDGVHPACVIEARGTELVFEEGSGESSNYHYAFNIPDARFEDGKRWLESFVPLLPLAAGLPPGLGSTGSTTIWFEDWNAHAVYFRDPDGNIAELIARHTLPDPSEGEFDASCIRRVSEVLVATDDVAAAVAHLAGLGLEPYRRPLPNFAPVGDEEGLIIVSQTARPMLPTIDTPALDRPARIRIETNGRRASTEPPPSSSQNAALHSQIAHDVTAASSLDRPGGSDQGAVVRLPGMRVVLDFDDGRR